MTMMRFSLLLLLVLTTLLSLFHSNSAFVVAPFPQQQARRSSSAARWGASSSGRQSRTRSSSLSSVNDEKNIVTEKSSRSANADDTSQAAKVPQEWRGQVLRQLKNIIDPDLGSDIVTLGFVQNLRLSDDDDDDSSSSRAVVSFDVELTTPACPVKDAFAADCQTYVSQLPWVGSVNVTMTAQDTTQNDAPTLGMSQVGAVIAVSSCKGGVGKSTTAVNLAFALQSMGATVGIFDADVYGPSLPTMVQPDDDIVRFVGRQVAPLQRNGVRLMSFGYVNEGSAVMRGPMVTQLLDQFMSVTHWGKLDYLVLDMPPGTGDIPLTLTQKLNITAAVIVTTPQELSFADVVRGIEMFDSVNVPSVAVVENMAYFEQPPQSQQKSLVFDTDKLQQAMVEKLKTVNGGLLLPRVNGGDSLSTTGIDKLASELVDIVVQQQQQDKESTSDDAAERIQIFGPGHKHRLSEQWGIEHTFSMPLLPNIAANGDSGTPFVLEYPDSPQAAIYKELASAVVTEVAKAKFRGSNNRPEIVYDKDKHVLVVNHHGGDNGDGDSVDRKTTTTTTLTPASLRRECRCASCVEEMTGRQILVKTAVPETIEPRKLYPTGNYALSVDWSDGHRSLYPYRQILSLLQEQQQTKQQEEKEQATMA